MTAIANIRGIRVAANAELYLPIVHRATVWQPKDILYQLSGRETAFLSGKIFRRKASNMAEQILGFAVLIVLIFALNLIPVFAPPTWMALAFVGFQFPETNPWVLALVGAGAATLGRLTLALISHKIVGKKLLSKAQRANVDEIKRRLEKRTTLTFGIFLSYAFSPLPSNFLFIAYGLTGLPLLRVALPFFLGRFVSYAFFITGGQAAGRSFQIDSLESTLYASGYFMVTQLVVMAALYAFTRIDWQVLLDDHRFVWTR